MQVKKDIEKAASIGLIPIKAGALGDSLLYLIFANNLARNGYSVTLYSNVLISMQEFFPQVTICNIDFTKDEMERISQKHLFVLADNSITQLFEDAFHERLSELFVFTFYGKTRLIGKGAAFHKTRVKSLVSEAMFEKLLPILDVSNHSIVTNRTLTMADNIALFCEKIWQLKNVTKEVGVILPEYLKYRCHSKRVIIHPTSGNVYKNWSLKKFIKLARLLKAKY